MPQGFEKRPVAILEGIVIDVEANMKQFYDVRFPSSLPGSNEFLMRLEPSRYFLRISYKIVSISEKIEG